MDNASLLSLLPTLQKLDTCAVANAIEQLDVRLRNEGYTDSTIRCQTIGKSSLVGFADTIRVKTGNPPPNKKLYSQRTDWWQHLLSLPQPRILVVEEIDHTPLSGAFIGEVHANILCALGCAGVITNGAVRDIPKLAALNFAAFSSAVSVSHSYVHIIEYGVPVKVAGLSICPGDLLHGDQHGVLTIPTDAASRLPAVAANLEEREKRIIRYCKSDQFSISGLESILSD